MTRPTMSDASSASKGVMINRGTQFSISGIRITVSADGNLDAGSPTFSLSLDLTSYWLEIAVSQFRDAEKHHHALLAASRSDDNDGVSRSMEAECKASMQAFAAAAIALDAFYAAVKDRTPIPADLIAIWHAKGTARYKQITEVFRRAFRMGPRSAVHLRKRIREVFKWRDRAVHPQSARTQAVLYQELSVGTEWRFVAFMAENARHAVGSALSLIAQLLARPRKEHSDLVAFCGPALTNIQPTIDAWEATFGELFDHAAARDTV
ncbi:MAG: hypothetical protein ACSLFK_16665 [Gemmatimonadaceae bacterium]